MPKKILFILSFLVSYITSYSQVFVPRSSGAITAEDYRLSAKLNFYLPRVKDTSLNGGLDTLGASIYNISLGGVYDGHIYVRDSNTVSGGHKWVKVLKNGDISGTTWGGITGIISNQTDLQNALNLKLNISDTTGKWVTSLYRKPGSDSVFFIKNGVSIFAYHDSIGVPGIISLNGQTVSTQTFNSGISGTDFNISSSGGVHTFNLPVVGPNDTGKVTPALYNTWNAKLGSTLSPTHIFVGNGSSIATDVAMSGDATINSAGGVSLASIISPSSCTNCNITFDAKGRITTASNGSGGGGGNTNSNVGSGYRWAIPNTNNLKTAFPGFATLIDSIANTNGLTFTTDTSSSGLSGYYVRIKDSTKWYYPLNSNPKNYLTANQTITFSSTGDVQGTSSGTISLTPALTIQPLAVTNGKMANGTANSLAGYNGSGAFSGVTIGSGLSLSGGTLSASGGGTGNLDAVLALGGRLSANRSVSMGSFRWTLDSANMHLRVIDTAALTFDRLPSSSGNIVVERINPVPASDAEATPWLLVMEHADNGDGTFNNVVKFGNNVNQISSNSLPASWYAMEPNYHPGGGAEWTENHLVAWLANGTERRLFSATTARRSTWALSDNNWDFRATNYNFYATGGPADTTLMTLNYSKASKTATATVLTYSGLSGGNQTGISFADESSGSGVQIENYQSRAGFLHYTNFPQYEWSNALSSVMTLDANRGGELNVTNQVNSDTISANRFNFNSAGGIYVDGFRYVNVKNQINELIGIQAGQTVGNSAAYNVALGYLADQSLTNAFNNIAIGSTALRNNSTGSGSISIGVGSANGPSVINKSVFIGDSAANNATGIMSFYGWSDISNKLWIDNKADSTALIFGDFNLKSVAINGINDSSAYFTLNGTKRGFLISKLTTAQMNAIVRPAGGLQIWNTDSLDICVNIGTQTSPIWVKERGGSGSSTPIKLNNVGNSGIQLAYVTGSASDTLNIKKCVNCTTLTDSSFYANTLEKADQTLPALSDRTVDMSTGYLVLKGTNGVKYRGTGTAYTYTGSATGTAPAYYQFGWTTQAGAYTRGYGYSVDTFNNVNIGVNSTTYPSYSTGNNLFLGYNLAVNGAQYQHFAKYVSNATLSLGDNIVYVDATSGNVTITLPSASSTNNLNSGAGVGIVYSIKRIDASANTVTVTRQGSDLIDGGTSFTLASFESKVLQSAGATNWYTL